MDKKDKLRNEQLPDVEVVTALINAINESERRAFRIRMSALFNASI